MWEKVDQALVDACYRSLISKDWQVDEAGITSSMPLEDMVQRFSVSRMFVPTEKQMSWFVSL